MSEVIGVAIGLVVVAFLLYEQFDVTFGRRHPRKRPEEDQDV